MDSTATPVMSSTTDPQTNSDTIKTDDRHLRMSYEYNSGIGNKYNVMSAEGDSDPKEDGDGKDSEDNDDTENSGYSSDADPALMYYHPDDVAYRRSKGLEYDQMFGWFRPGGNISVNCKQKGVVFIDSEDEED